MTCLRTRLTPEQVAERHAQRTAEAVTRRLTGEPETPMPLYTGKTTQDLAAYRIREIDMKTDVGYPWSNGPWYAEHHVRKAVSRIADFNSQWDWNVQCGPVNKAFALPRAMVLGLRDRIDPALHVLEAELDQWQELSDDYARMEAEALSRINRCMTRYKEDRRGRSASKKLKDRTSAELHDAMKAFHGRLVDRQRRITVELDHITN